MAKRPKDSRKTLKSSRRKGERTFLSNSIRKETSQCGQSTPSLPSSPSLPSHSPTTCCNCQAKFAKLQLLDESTNDCLDITWVDKSRMMCSCQKGKASNRVEEILNSMPSVDSPTSKHDRLSLGSVDIQDDTRLKQRSLKRDASGLKVLNTLLQEIKSPLSSQKTQENPDVSMSAVSNLKENEDCTRKEQPILQTTCTPHNSQDNLVDLLFSDSNILDDLSTFSPLSIANTPSSTENKPKHSRNTAPSIDRAENAAHTPNIKTPFRHSLTLRKRLLPTSNCNDTNILCNTMQSDPKPTQAAINDTPNDDFNGINLPDDDQFWTQVAASTIDVVDLTPHGGVEDALPDLDDDTIKQLFEGGDDCIDICDNSQPRVCSQQDIEAKRMQAKRKLQKKFRTV